MPHASRVSGLSLSLSLSLSLCLLGCSSSEDVGLSQAAVTGGVLADSPEFDAVLCIPQFGAAGVSSGWSQPIRRCAATATLITPTIVVTDRGRLDSQTFYYTQPSIPNDAFELGSAVNAVDDGPTALRRPSGCLEPRRSGLAPCCWHPMRADPALGTPPPPYAGNYMRYYYIPPSDLRDTPFTDTAAHGGVVAVETYTNYNDYLRSCPVPMAEDDGLVSSMIFFLLPERVPETEISPIPLALSFPGGTSDPVWFTTGSIFGDIVGYGYGEEGTNSRGFHEGIRRVAFAATALTPLDPLADPTDPTSKRPDAWVFTHDGGEFRTQTAVRGDGGRGASHMDFGAPWLYGRDPDRRVYAVSAGGVYSLDELYQTLLTPLTAGYVREFLDPDGDGIHRGFLDMVDPATGRRRTDYIDADGDGFSEYRLVGGELRPTSNDNCPPPRAGRWVYDYRNPDQLDADGDLVGDACDVCPHPDYPLLPRRGWNPGQESCTAVREVPASSSPTGRLIARGEPVGLACTDRADADGDLFPDAFCDSCPGPNPVPAGSPPGTLQPDRDGDGVGDECDICPDVPDAAQDRTDADADGVFDACDNCPPSRCAVPTDCANPAEADGTQLDTDGDRLGDVCDNCPLHPNLAQQNCNVEAEVELASQTGSSVPMLGDACDPVPCAETQISERPRTSPRGTVTYSMDRVELDARIGTEDPDLPPASLDARTSFRFCRCSFASSNSPAARRRCVAEELDGMGRLVDGGCTLLDLLAHDAEPEQLPWRRTTHAFLSEPLRACRVAANCRPGEGCDTDPARPGEPGQCRCLSGLPGACPVVDTYDPPTGTFVADRETRWRIREDDVPRWITSRLVPGETFPPNASIRGVHWIHTPGPDGQPDFDLLPGFGTEFRQLASYYWSGGQTPPFTAREPSPCLEPFVPFLGGSGICIFCQAHTPLPWIAFPSFRGCLDFSFIRPFVVLGVDPIEPFAELPLAGLELFANDPGPWVWAAETGQWLDDEQGLRYVKLESGSEVTRVIEERAGAFVEGGQGCPQPPCELAPFPFAAAAAPSVERVPPRREGHAAVLSSRREALWVIGGRSAPGGAELRDLWRYDLRAERWSPLPLPAGVTLGRVLAATYSPVEDRLFVLDVSEVVDDDAASGRGRGSGERGREHGRGSERSTQIRLLSIHPEGGLGAVEASWTRRSRNASFAMSVDPDGALFVAGWPTAGHVHAVVRLVRAARDRHDRDHGEERGGGSRASGESASDGDTTGRGWEVGGWDVGVGRLRENGVRASDRGLTVVAEVSPRRGPVLVFHATAELRAGRGGEAACF